VLLPWTTSFKYYLRNEGLLCGYVVRPAVLALGSGLYYDTGSVVLARDGALAIVEPNTARVGHRRVVHACLALETRPISCVGRDNIIIYVKAVVFSNVEICYINFTCRLHILILLLL